MPVLRKEGPYIWVTWLTKLLTGDDSCEHASWFKTQFDAKSWTKAERVTNLARWQVGHTDLKNAKAREFREQGYQVSHETQNHFTIKGKLATIAGKPDLIARQGDLVWVTDVKSGRPRASDVAQVMIYMYLLPVARPDLQGATVKGLVVYGSHEQEIQSEEVDPAFVQSAGTDPPAGSQGAGVQGAQLVRVPVLRHQQRPLSRARGAARQPGGHHGPVLKDPAAPAPEQLPTHRY